MNYFVTDTENLVGIGSLKNQLIKKATGFSKTGWYKWYAKCAKSRLTFKALLNESLVVVDNSRRLFGKTHLCHNQTTNMIKKNTTLFPKVFENEDRSWTSRLSEECLFALSDEIHGNMVPYFTMKAITN